MSAPSEVRIVLRFLFCALFSILSLSEHFLQSENYTALKTNAVDLFVRESFLSGHERKKGSNKSETRRKALKCLPHSQAV